MKAKELKVGQRLRMAPEDDYEKISDIHRGRGFRVAMPGQKDAYGITVTFGQNWSVLHPEEPVDVA